jgi:hypothetical protein
MDIGLHSNMDAPSTTHVKIVATEDEHTITFHNSLLVSSLSKLNQVNVDAIDDDFPVLSKMVPDVEDIPIPLPSDIA